MREPNDKIFVQNDNPEGFHKKNAGNKKHCILKIEKIRSVREKENIVIDGRKKNYSKLTSFIKLTLNQPN